MVYKRYLSIMFMAAGVLLVAAAGTIIQAKAVEPVSDKQIILYLRLGEDGFRITHVQLKNSPYFRPKAAYSGDVRIELLSDHNQVLYEKRFESIIIYYWDEIDPVTGNVIDSGSEESENTVPIITLPDFENVKKIKVYRQKTLNTPEPKTIEQLINTVQLPPRSRWEVIP